jgi:hypothetical protein
MNPDLQGVWEHMRNLGLGALAHANRHAAYAAMENDRWPDLSVLQAAHAAELLIKARIAQEHPLLIFNQLPRSTQATGSDLNLDDLFKEGRTVQWSDLPERLWASTDLMIPNRDRYDSFGKLRNGIQHFAPAQGVNPGSETLRFVFEVVDPFINQCWGLFAVDYDEDFERYIYFVHALVAREIPFLVSPEAAAEYENWDVDWNAASVPYRTQMQQRAHAAKQQTG